MNDDAVQSITIMAMVMPLLILAIGVFVFYNTMIGVPVMVQNESNSSSITNNLSNTMGIVLVLGAVIVILGLIVGYMRPDTEEPNDDENEDDDETEEYLTDKKVLKKKPNKRKFDFFGNEIKKKGDKNE